jgi:hypothetical protein
MSPLQALVRLVALAMLNFASTAQAVAADGAHAPTAHARLKPVRSTDTGLLLEPALDLSKFTHADFLRFSETVGKDRLNRPWTQPITPLPPHPRADARGLTHAEVKEYMFAARRLFDAGKSAPISDAGLISTQEDVIRRPMFNHIAAFSNATVAVYLLVQSLEDQKEWHYFSIVTDRTVKPPIDYFANLSNDGDEAEFEGHNCYKCHSSGPLAIHPAREDLINDVPLMQAINAHIEEHGLSRFHFPESDPAKDYGEPLKLRACTKCHDTDADRAPLFRVHSHPIRILVDFGYMPPKHAIKPEDLAQLKAWLAEKPAKPAKSE